MSLATKARLCDQTKWTYIYDANGTHDGTTPTMIDMAGWDRCCVMVLGAGTTASATNLVTGFKIVSNTTSAGAGTDHDIAEAITTETGTTKTLTCADFGVVAPTTLGSQMLCLDIGADQMYAGDRYVGAVLAATGTFTCTIVYVQYNGTSFKDVFQTTRTAFQYDGDL